MKKAVVLVLAALALPVLVSCGNRNDKGAEMEDPAAFAARSETKACITALKQAGTIGEEQEVFIYTDNVRLQDAQNEHPSAYVTTISRLTDLCRQAGHPL